MDGDVVFPGGLHYLSLTDIAALIRSGEVTSRRVTECLLERICWIDPVLSGYVTMRAEQALVEAENADSEIAAGRVRGPLHGVPLALKDLIYTSDTPTGAGMAARRDWRPPFDATVVSRLRAAGAIILGKLAMTEAATFPHHPELPQPLNPWDPDRWAGASSSGCGVATAAGLCFGSLGSDTGGSIRLPCAANNLTGLKPTWGRVSRYGVFPMMEPLDTVGPMARSAADVAVLFDAIAGYDPLDPTSIATGCVSCATGLDAPGIRRGLKIGIDPAFNGDDADPTILRLVDAATATLAEAGAEIRDVRMPPMEGLRELMPAYGDAHLLAVHEEIFAANTERYGVLLRHRLEAARMISPATVAAAEKEKLIFEGRIAALLGDVDMLLFPVMNRTMPKLADIQANPILDMKWMFKFSGVLNYAGGPIVSLPCGFTESGFPVGFQLMGAKLSEPRLLQVAHAYQQATDWHLRHPSAFQ